MSYVSPAEGFSLEELAKSLTSNFVLLTQEGNSNAWKYKSGVIISWLKNLCLMDKKYWVAVLGFGIWGWGCGWWVVHTHTHYKFTHKFLMMLLLVTIWCCLQICYRFIIMLTNIRLIEVMSCKMPMSYPISFLQL